MFMDADFMRPVVYAPWSYTLPEFIYIKSLPQPPHDCDKFLVH